MLRLLHKSPEQLRTQANVTTNLTRSSASQGKDRKESSNSAEPKKKETHSEKKEFANKRAPIEKPKTPPPDPVKKEIKSSKQSKYENFNFKGNLFEKLLKDENTKKSLMEDRTSKKSESVGSKDQKATFLDKAKSSQEPKEHSNSEFRDGKIKKEMENKEESKVILVSYYLILKMIVIF